MNQGRFFKTAMIALLLLALMPLGGPSLSFMQSTAHAAEEDKTVKQGWFYARPDDGTSVRTLAERMSWMTVTRGHFRWLREMRDAGYEGDAIEYLLVLEVQGPGPYKNSDSSCNSNFEPANNTVAYNVGDFCKYVHPHEGWFLHNGRGHRLVYERPDGSWDYQMDPRSEGWRSFVRDRALRDLAGDGQQDALGFDGIYFDNIPMRLYRHLNQLRNSDGTVREYDDDASYRKDVVDFLAYMRSALRPHGKLWANLIDFYGVSVKDYLRYTNQLDGYMSEAWGPGYLGRERDAESEEAVLEIAEHTLEQGKELMAVVQGQRGDHTRQRYGLAQYLLVSDSDEAYFRYAYLNGTYTESWQYSNYDLELGQPKGGRYKSNGEWRRDFECGYVTADLEKERGEIVKTSCSDDDDSPPPSDPSGTVDLPARIQAEDYGKGEGKGYRDTTNGNQGGEYRNDDVDIQSCGSDCYHVSHIVEGEWLAYKVNARWTDNYAIRLRVAAPDGGQRVRVEVDGREVIDSWALPGTGSWENWETVSKKIRLKEGTHKIKIVAETGWFNLNYIEIEEARN